METIASFGTNWFPKEKTIDTHISGLASLADVDGWEESLHNALSQIDDNGCFKIMIDLYGFTAVDLESHKRFRTIIPVTLLQYGWKVGYIDLFTEESGHLQFSNTRGIRCMAAAHAHHDETKIGLYERSYSRQNERFFTDPHAAREWLKEFSI